MTKELLDEALSAPDLLNRFKEIKGLEKKITEKDEQVQTVFRDLITKPQTRATEDDLASIEHVHKVYLAHLLKLSLSKTKLLSKPRLSLADSLNHPPPPPPRPTAARPKRPDWPHLVYVGSGRSIELRCFCCHGSGHETDDGHGFKYLSGLVGLAEHIYKVHGAQLPVAILLKECAVRKLSEAEVRALLVGGSVLRPMVEWPYEDTETRGAVAVAGDRQVWNSRVKKLRATPRTGSFYRRKK
ncbi:hypothetical protein BU16DRAFT_558178 [Lophium mytilinum]|uniref:Uncharacterized protein n=1 Tax=Lophium mytilinum TaxID=390894 RepID=A0A6A6R7R0_9PEZI|nr:hypothetical protein BU16DRAFT_558178 [Lophium mytilinum]